MKSKQPSIPMLVLETLSEMAGLLPQFLPRPFETKYAWAGRLRHIDPDSYRRTVNRMKRRGLIKPVEQNGKKFIQLTKSGQLEILLQKAQLKRPKIWDGKWRLIIYDIPESSKGKRSLLRQLLKRNNFFQLQASVYIHPFPLNRQAISYLEQSGLIDFIRILKVEEIDNAAALLKRFGLKKS